MPCRNSRLDPCITKRALTSFNASWKRTKRRARTRDREMSDPLLKGRGEGREEMSRTKSPLMLVALLILSTSGASFAQTTRYFLNPMPPVPPIQGTPFVPTALNGSDTIAGNVTIHGPGTPNPPYGLQSVAYLTQRSQITALGGMAGNNANLNAYIFVAALNNLDAAAG